MEFIEKYLAGIFGYYPKIPLTGDLFARAAVSTTYFCCLSLKPSIGRMKDKDSKTERLKLNQVIFPLGAIRLCIQSFVEKNSIYCVYSLGFDI